MDKKWMIQMAAQNQLQAVLDTNQYTEKFGLRLSEQSAEVLVKARVTALQKERRVEFAEGILPKLIFEFCDSDFIDQEHYEEILVRLQEIFYLYKNEMLDEITDDELLHFMRECYDDPCFGDLEYLAGTCLENFAQAVRAGYQDYQASDGYGERSKLAEVPTWDYQLYMDALAQLF